MFEFRGLIASAAKNENAGFVTPQNKNTFSRKNLFTDKPKMAFGDLKKNSVNVITPMKNGTAEKPKQSKALLQHVFAPSSIASKETIASTPKPENRHASSYDIDEMDLWHQRQMLSEDQFDLLFMRPPETSAPPPESPPPSPTPEPVEDCTDLYTRVPIWDREFKISDGEVDLPQVNNSFTDDSFDCSH